MALSKKKPAEKPEAKTEPEVVEQETATEAPVEEKETAVAPEAPEAQVAPEPEVVEPEASEVPEQEPEVDNEPEVDDEPVAAKDTMVKVRNRARFDYVQPSTGIKVRSAQAEPTKVLDDVWLDQFVAAGLLERV